jgi:hypothetical protein
VHLRLKPLAAPSAINGALEFGALLDQLWSSILLLGGILCSPPSSCATGAKAIPLEPSLSSNSFRVFSITLPCAPSSITSESVEVFQALGAPRSQRLQPFLLSGLLLIPNPTCTHLHGSNTSGPLWGKEKQEFNYLASSTHSMRRFFTALDAGISRPKQRNN